MLERAAAGDRIEAACRALLVSADQYAGANADGADLDVAIEHAPALFVGIRITAAGEDGHGPIMPTM